MNKINWSWKHTIISSTINNIYIPNSTLISKIISYTTLCTLSSIFRTLREIMHVTTFVALGVHIATWPLLVIANITCRRWATMFLVVDCCCWLTTTSWLWTVHSCRSATAGIGTVELVFNYMNSTITCFYWTNILQYCQKVVSEARHTSKAWVKVKSLIPNSLSFRTLSFIPRINLSFIKLSVRLPKSNELFLSLRSVT